MSNMVQITNGFHRGHAINGVFKMVKPYQEAAGGGIGFITIEAPTDAKWAITLTPRIKLRESDYQILGADADVSTFQQPESVSTSMAMVPRQAAIINFEQEFIDSETEEEAILRIAETFGMLDKIVDACANGTVRGLVVSGPPGVGKSHGVEKTLEKANLFNKIGNMDSLYEFVTGGVSPIGLYQKLYFNRAKEKVLVFDDCDTVLFDEECLTLLKGALNSGDKRRINWNKESRVLNTEGIPNSFDFDGSIIFLSNVNFQKTIEKGHRISAHLEAIMSRCHYLDLQISTTRDKLLRIKQVVRDGMLSPYGFSHNEEQIVIDFVFDNHKYLRELSLRMVKKIADFVKASPQDWYAMTEATCLTKEARYQRLLERKKLAAMKDVEMQEV